MAKRVRCDTCFCSLNFYDLPSLVVNCCCRIGRCALYSTIIVQIKEDLLSCAKKLRIFCSCAVTAFLLASSDFFTVYQNESKILLNYN